MNATTSIEDVLIRLESRLRLAVELVEELKWQDEDEESEVVANTLDLLRSTSRTALVELKKLYKSLPASILSYSGSESR